jgi:hypothetical protein
MDYGYVAPTACLWLARSPDPIVPGTKKRRIIVYREFYRSGLTVSQQAALILGWSKAEQVHLTLADPSLWARNQSHRDRGVSLAEEFRAAGLHLVRAINDRLTGVARIHQALAWDEEEEPELQVFSNCVNLIRTLPELVRDPVRPELYDTDGEDHCADGLRYSLMGAARREQDLVINQYRLVSGSVDPRRDVAKDRLYEELFGTPPPGVRR